MRIVVDAMGSDNAPVPDVEGAVMAAKETGAKILLVGPQDVVQAELDKHDLTGASIEVVHASEVITMEDHTLAVKTKTDSSMVVGIKMVRQGKADAFVSAGNSGAVMAAALFNLGRIKGIMRPAITAIYPTMRGHSVFLDVGANTDCKPEYLYQFALMGQAYAERALGLVNPSVGLLSNGEEEGKGTMLVRDAYELFKAAPFNFVGNVEGKDLPAGMADVVVSDGFTGNVAVKLSEGLVMSIMRMIKHKLTGDGRAKLAAVLMIPAAILALPGLLLLWPVLKDIVQRFNPDKVGGAPLLGVRGPVIIGHGRSNAKAVANAIRAAARTVENDVQGAITAALDA